MSKWPFNSWPDHHQPSRKQITLSQGHTTGHTQPPAKPPGIKYVLEARRILPDAWNFSVYSVDIIPISLFPVFNCKLEDKMMRVSFDRSLCVTSKIHWWLWYTRGLTCLSSCTGCIWWHCLDEYLSLGESEHWAKSPPYQNDVLWLWMNGLVEAEEE